MFRKGGMGVKPRTLKIYFYFLKRESKIELFRCALPHVPGEASPWAAAKGCQPWARGAGRLLHFGEPAGMPEGGGGSKHSGLDTASAWDLRRPW